MTKNFFILMMALLIGFNAFARTLVVSDIDDTIKISRVLSKEKYLTGPDFSRHFAGMSELYQAFDRTENDVEFAYVSNAPFLVMTIPHFEFLTYNRFPEGGLYLKQSPLTKTHKFDIISKIIQTSKPDRIVMIGDNGEADATVYAAIRTKFSQIPSFTFIHQVYSTKSTSYRGKPLLAGQIGFVTAADLAEQFQKAGLLQNDSLERLLQQIVPVILREPLVSFSGEMAFPDWMNCQDFKNTMNTKANQTLIPVSQAVQKFCKLP